MCVSTCLRVLRGAQQENFWLMWYIYVQFSRILSLPENIFSLLVEREGKREDIDVREEHQLVAFSHAPQPGIKPTT